MARYSTTWLLIYFFVYWRKHTIWAMMLSWQSHEVSWKKYENYVTYVTFTRKHGWFLTHDVQRRLILHHIRQQTQTYPSFIYHWHFKCLNSASRDISINYQINSISVTQHLQSKGQVALELSQHKTQFRCSYNLQQFIILNWADFSLVARPLTLHLWLYHSIHTCIPFRGLIPFRGKPNVNK